MFTVFGKFLKVDVSEYVRVISWTDLCLSKYAMDAEFNFRYSAMSKSGEWQPVKLFQPKYRLGHPRKYSFLLLRIHINRI